MGSKRNGSPTATQRGRENILKVAAILEADMAKGAETASMVMEGTVTEDMVMAGMARTAAGTLAATGKPPNHRLSVASTRCFSCSRGNGS